MASTPADLYKFFLEAARADPSVEPELLADFDGTLKRRFGLELPASGRLERRGDGFRLTLGGRSYDLGSPSAVQAGELTDGDLELVSGGGGTDCGDPNNSHHKYSRADVEKNMSV